MRSVINIFFTKDQVTEYKCLGSLKFVKFAGEKKKLAENAPRRLVKLNNICVSMFLTSFHNKTLLPIT